MAGNAVRETALKFIERLRSVASDYFGRPNVEIAWTDGRFHVDGKPGVTMQDLARFAADRGEVIDVPGTFEYTGLKPFSYGTHAAHVAVDPRTGRSSSWISWRSRISAVCSIRSSFTARRSAPWFNRSAAPSLNIWSMTSTASC
jgi:hypothetical protein